MDDYLVLAEDLAEQDLRDVLAGLDDLGKALRAEGETAFPGLGTLLHAVRERRRVRTAKELEEIDSRAWEEHMERWRRERLEDAHIALTPMERTLNELLQAATVHDARRTHSGTGSPEGGDR